MNARRNKYIGQLSNNPDFTAFSYPSSMKHSVGSASTREKMMDSGLKC